jgi:hypothetical protein
MLACITTRRGKDWSPEEAEIVAGISARASGTADFTLLFLAVFGIVRTGFLASWDENASG